MHWRPHVCGGFIADGDRDYYARTTPARDRIDPRRTLDVDYIVVDRESGLVVVSAQAQSERWAREACEEFITAKREGKSRWQTK